MRVMRTKDYGNRNAVLLEGESVRVVVSDKGGMVPELSFPSGRGWYNTHWIPHFRRNVSSPYSESEHGNTWPVELLYEIAGNFLCLPNFGGPCKAYDLDILAHGLTANAPWSCDSWGEFAGRAVYQRSSIAPSDAYNSIPLSVIKYDVVFDDHPGHYVYLRVKNTGDRPYRTNLGWHNTIGAPFLAPGCRIDLCADAFATPPKPSEFDETTRLATGAIFDDLGKAPLADGGTVDLHLVPGMIGYTDFITGAVPESADIGWSSVVNPAAGALYLSVFPGPAKVDGKQIPINFNNLWMQYGGRPFAPWSSRTNGTDYSFCLGAENSIGAYANGLEYSLEHDQILGRPTTYEIAPGAEVDHVYATFVVPYDGGAIDDGVTRVEVDVNGLSVIPNSGGSAVSVPADGRFEALLELAEAMEDIE
jgi:hypothetical protein